MIVEKGKKQSARTISWIRRMEKNCNIQPNNTVESNWGHAYNPHWPNSFEYNYFKTFHAQINNIGCMYLWIIFRSSRVTFIDMSSVLWIFTSICPKWIKWIKLKPKLWSVRKHFFLFSVLNFPRSLVSFIFYFLLLSKLWREMTFWILIALFKCSISWNYITNFYRLCNNLYNERTQLFLKLQFHILMFTVTMYVILVTCGHDSLQNKIFFRINKFLTSSM